MRDRVRGDASPPHAPEAELLLCCALVRADGARLARAGEILYGALDWARVARYALRHRLAPLLHVHLDAIGGGRVPAEVTDALRAHHHANARRNLRMSGELHLLLRGFADAGITAAALKGPWLAAQADGSTALRTFRDLDLLVRPGDAARAQDVMHARGYRLHRPSAAGAKDALFFRPADGCAAEVHHALGSAAQPLSFGLDDVRGRLDRVPVLGVPVPGLPLEENLLFLAHHGGAHAWSRLAWLTGFAQTLRTRGGELDAARLHARAVELGMGRRLRLALRLSDDLLGISIPGPLAEIVRADARAGRLAERAAAGLFREAAADGDASPPAEGAGEAAALLAAATAWLEGNPRAGEETHARAPLREVADTFLRHASFAVGAGDRARDGVRFLATVAFAPHPADVRAFRLRGPLRVLYPLLRPARIACTRAVVMPLRRVFRYFFRTWTPSGNRPDG